MILDDEQCTTISKYTEKLIQDRNYPLEVHSVKTEDNYINSVYRICKSSELNTHAPVLVVHGLASSVAEAVTEDYQLGYYLADNGYDVWIANCRGTTYSRGHQNYHHVKNKNKYWNFGIHEIGHFDLAAFIDYILMKTNHKKLLYIGLSQGSATLLILLSNRQEYNEKISSACLMCPGGFFGHVRFWPLKFFLSYAFRLKESFTRVLRISNYEITDNYWIRKFGMMFGKPNTLGHSVFSTFINMTCGHRNPQCKWNANFTEICMAFPNTASYKQLVHFRQMLEGKKFAHFDYGPEENLKIYGNVIPPLYDLSQVTAPVSLFYSKNDMYYGIEDMEELASKLGNCVYKHEVEDPYFNHINFTYHPNVIELVYSHILRIFQEHKHSHIT